MLRAICNVLGASVRIADLPGKTSGFIIKYSGQDPEIFINAQDSRERQKLTLAHELGHLWERRELARDDEYSFVDKRDGTIDLHEFFANEFAGALLMPKELFESVISEGDVRAASVFGVSEAAVRRRQNRLEINP